MSIFFQDPNITRLPPEEVRLIEVKVTPQANSGRVKIFLELTPFLKRPNISVTILDASGKEAAHSEILETMLPKLEFTLHLRQPEAGGPYSLEACVYYQPLPEPDDSGGEVKLPEPLIVDTHKTSFNIPKMEV